MQRDCGALPPADHYDQVISILSKGEVEMVYQPAIRLDTPRIEFFEALARFSSSSPEAPECWFEAAADIGLGAELEMLALSWAIEGLSILPEQSTVSVNVSPETILTSVFAEKFVSAPLDRIILEITERQAVQSYEALIETLEPLRRRGLRIAVDDAGAGYASFRHILHIRPDIIKLDMSLCRGIDEDHMRRALASALILFSRQIGSQLVAEGVETADELQSLRTLGMNIIQGHIIARPMRPEGVSMVEKLAAYGPDAINACLAHAA